MNTTPSFQMKKKHLAIALGVIGIGAVTLIATFFDNATRAWVNLLINSYCLLSLGLGGLLFLVLTSLTKGRWATVIKRIPEAMLASLPVASIFFLVLYFGTHSLFEWADAEHMLHDPILQQKQPYLNMTAFMIRTVVALSLWTFFAILIRRNSLAQEKGALPTHEKGSVVSSAGFIVLFAITFPFFCYDWLMSISPHWYSTIFSLYTFSSLFFHGIAAITLILIFLMERGYFTGFVNENHLHDLGKLILAFSTFWAYIWFSQYMLIWYSNISEEVVYFVLRTDSEWVWLFYTNIVINWLIPFFLLMPRASKRSLSVLKRVCILLLIGYWLDLFLMVAPSVLTERRIGPVEILIALGFGGIFFLVTARSLSKAPLIAKNDPHLEESLQLHQ